MKSVKLWVLKKYFRMVSKVLHHARKYSVLNHSNYSKRWNFVYNWAIIQTRLTKARIDGLECSCKMCQSAYEYELEKIRS